MKNIHIIPTYKLYAPSRLFYKEQELVFTKKYEVFNGVHIYITSDEEINEGDYYIAECGSMDRPVHKHIGKEPKGDYFKIILTTDQDLIKDGIQAIDNEFLEWFVENPSCESVEVEKGKMKLNDDGQEYGFPDMSLYKIIIPKEEPKYTTSNLDNEKYKDFSVAKQRAANYMSLKGALEPKQETLEEAAERLAYDSTEENKGFPSMKKFIEGAKWQQERMYSEEDLKEAFKSGRMVENYKGEWEETYSDEMTSCKYVDFNKWFEQFKKK